MGLYLNVFLLECIYFPCVCVNHPSSVCTSFLGVCKPFFTACTHVCFFLAGVHSYACFFLIAAYTFQLHVFIFLLSSFCLCLLSWLFLASLFSHPFPTYYYVFYSYPSHLCIVSLSNLYLFFFFISLSLYHTLHFLSSVSFLLFSHFHVFKKESLCRSSPSFSSASSVLFVRRLFSSISSFSSVLLSVLSLLSSFSSVSPPSRLHSSLSFLCLLLDSSLCLEHCQQ